MLLFRHKILESLGRQPIVVYTMGKVGSTTVYHAFQEQYFFPLTYYVHHLTSKSLNRTVNIYEKNGLPTIGKVSLLKMLKGSSSHLSASYILREAYSENSDRQWNIVTLVRDPISTYLSHLFQNPKIHRPYLLGDDGLIDKEKVKNFIHDIFLNFDPGKDYISNWFDREFLKFTDNKIAILLQGIML